MLFSSKLSPEQWAEARRLRAGGASYASIAERVGVGASTVSRRARREGWPSPGAATAPDGAAASASPATAGIRCRLALRLCRVIECRIRIMELGMRRQLEAHLQADAGGPDAAPPGKDEREGLAALIASINQVMEMASDPAPAAQGRRRTATGPVNPELTALSDDIDPDGLAIASEKDQHRRELAENLGKLSRSPELLDLLAAHLPREESRRLFNYEWDVIARDDQLAPVLAAGGGRWHTWLLLGGRGSGKTRAGAEWVRAQVIGEPPLADRRSRRIALVGDTIAQVRSIMIEGVSGLMSVYPPGERPKLEASKNQLVWDNGTMAQLFGADDPDSLRGPQFDAAWCDELAKWRRPDLAWDNLQFALRLGRWPQCVVTTTPRPLLLLKRILEDPATASTHSRTADNAAFLSPSFLAEMVRRYGDTALGRQELEGEIVEERLTGLWKRSHIEQSRMLARPELVRIVVAVDPPVTATAASDSCGIVVAGLGVDKRAYVLADRTVQGRDPSTWAKAAVAAWHDHEADAIVVETNQGGDLLVQMFKSIDAMVPVKKVYASRGKYVRAEPVATLYAEGRVAHVGEFPELERQMCDFAADGLSHGKSPDRLDALVWAVTELMLAARTAPGIRTL